jgi:hypothetical protein
MSATLTIELPVPFHRCGPGRRKELRSGSSDATSADRLDGAGGVADRRMAQLTSLEHLQWFQVTRRWRSRLVPAPRPGLS